MFDKECKQIVVLHIKTYEIMGKKDFFLDKVELNG